MADNKVIRISADLDGSVTRDIPAALQNITREAKVAAEALAAVNQRLGGAAGAPLTLGGAGAGGAAGAPPGFGGSQSSLKASGNSQATALKDTAREAQATGRVMQDAFRGVEPVLRNLATSIQGILDGMRQIKTQSGDISGPTPGQLSLLSYRGRSTEGAAGQTEFPGMGGMYGPAPGPGARFGNFDYNSAWARNVRLNRPAHLPDEEAGGMGIDGGGSGGPGLLSTLGGIPGLGGLARYAAPAGLAYAAYKAVDFGTQAFANIDVANDTEALQNSHFYNSRLRAAAGQTFGRNATRLLRGDLGWARATSLADADPEAAAMLTPDMLDTRLELAGHRAGLTRVKNDVTGQMLNTSSAFTFSNMKNQFSQAAQQTTVELLRPAEASRLGTLIGAAASKGMEAPKLGETIGKAAGLGELTQHGQLPHVEKPSIGGFLKYLVSEENLAHYDMGDLPEFGSTHRQGNKTPAEIKMIQEKAKIPIEMAQERQQRIQNEYEAGSMFNMIADNLMANSAGLLSETRTSGISQRERYNKKTGEFLGYGQELFDIKMKARGFSGAEGNAARAAMGRLAGRGNMGLGEAAMGAQAGGLFNAADLIGTGARMGGAGGPMGLYRAVQGAIGGPGGLDITAGGELSGVVAQMMEAGHGGVGGDLAMSAILGAAHAPGATAGEDLRAGRMMAGGLQGNAALFGGKVDPLGQALTRRAALKGTAGLSTYATDAVERLMGNPVELKNIMLGGSIPEGLQALGIEQKHIDTAMKEQNLQNITRIVKGKGGANLNPDTVGGRFAEMMIAGGGNLASVLPSFVSKELGSADDARLQALSGKKNLTAAERKELSGLQQRAARIRSSGLKGFAEIQASDLGGKQSADEYYMGLELQLAGGPGGRTAGGRGAGWKATGLEAGAQKTGAALDTEIMKLKHDLEKPLTDAQRKITVQALAEDQARQKLQSTPEGQATNIAVTTKIFLDALADLAAAMKRVAGGGSAKTTTPNRAGK